MTGSTLTEDLTPASVLSPWAPALQPLRTSWGLWSPGMALLRRLNLRRRWLLLVWLALVPALLVTAAWLRGEQRGIAALDGQLRGVAQSRSLLSATMPLRDSPAGADIAPPAQAIAALQKRLRGLVEELQSTAKSREEGAEVAALLQQRLGELNQDAAAAPTAGSVRQEDVEQLQRELQILRLRVQQGTALEHDADARVRDLADATAQSLPSLTASLQASLQSLRASALDGAQRRELSRALIERRAQAVLAVERARASLLRSVAARWLDRASVAATLALIEQQLAAMDRVARAAIGEAPVGPALAENYALQTRRTLLAVAQLESQGLDALREPLRVRREALVQRAAMLAAALAAWLLALIYGLACASRLLDASLQSLADASTALRSGDDAHVAFQALRGDELEQAWRLVDRCAQHLRQRCAELSLSGHAVVNDALVVVAGQGALVLRTGEIRGACVEVASRFASLGTIFDDCAHSAESAGVEAQALSDEARYARRAQSGLRARLLAASGTNREIAHVLQKIEAVAAQTRLLALNALVEAERSGAAGKGFVAVVQELRALAQRNEDAARSLQPLIAGVIGEIDDCHRASELAGQAEQDTDHRLDAVQRGVADIVRRAEHGGTETRQMLQSAQRVEGGLDDMLDQLERLSQALTTLRGQSRALQATLQAIDVG